MLLARVRAQPIEGAANSALEALIAKALGVPKRSVALARGGQSRTKAVEIDGVDQAMVEAALGKPAV